jgi:hypothetical protein
MIAENFILLLPSFFDAAKVIIKYVQPGCKLESPHSEWRLVAFPAISFDNKIDAFDFDTLRQFEFGDGNIFYTKCLLAVVAVEMCMQIIRSAIAVVSAQGIFHGAGPVVKTVYQFAFVKQAYGA